MPSLIFLSTSIGFGADGAPGGGEFFASEFLGEMSRRGWAVTLVCPPRSPFLRDPALLSALREVVTLEVASGPGRPHLFLPALLRWLRLALRHRRSLFYGNGMVTLKWLTPAILLLGVRAVCHLHESSYEYYDTRRTRLQSPLVRHFFAISQTVRDLYHTGSRTPLDKITLVHNGVPVAPEVLKSPEETAETRRAFNLPPAGPLLVMAARTDPAKGHEILLRALPEVLRSRPDTHLLIAGFQPGTPAETALHARLLQLARDLRLESAVTFIGHTPHVRRLMRAADIVIVPSTSEGFGRTAIEAMAERTALVASNVGGLAEIVTHGVDGLHFPPGDHAALAAALLRLLDHPAERQALAAAGHHTALARFSLPAMTDRIETELSRIAPPPLFPFTPDKTSA